MRLAKMVTSAVVCASILALPAAMAGEIKGLRGKAVAVGEAGQRQLAKGARLGPGDLVTTAAGGTVQISFDGATRMVAGPGSSMKVEKLDLKGGSGGKKLDVQALEGVFRFISDESGDKNFEIRTPTATLALRGTAFDFTVTRGQGTRLLLLDGEVTMCGTGEGAECRTVATPCALLRTDDGKTVEQVGSAAGAKPTDEAGNPVGNAGTGEVGFEREIRENFPFQQSESGLLEEFRVAGEPCSRNGGIAEFAVDTGTIRNPQVISGAAVMGLVIFCVLLCGPGDSTTATNHTN